MFLIKVTSFLDTHPSFWPKRGPDRSGPLTQRSLQVRVGITTNKQTNKRPQQKRGIQMRVAQLALNPQWMREFYSFLSRLHFFSLWPTFF